MEHIKSLEHRRIEQALIHVYKSIYDQTPIYIREIFVLRNNGYNPRGHLNKGCSCHLICSILSCIRHANNGTIYQTN